MEDEIKQKILSDSFRLDELKEVGNISAGNTSVTLSNMISKEIKVSMTEVRVVSVENINELSKPEEEPYVGLLLGIGGDLKGFLLLVTPKKTACMISDIMNGKNPPSAVELKEEDISALKELGNILVGSYLAAMANLSKMDIIESTPDLLVGKLPDLFQKSLEKYDGGAKNAIVIGTKLFINSEEFKEELIMFLEPESFDKLFIALDKKIQT